MAVSDPIGDMLTRIRNGQRARMAAVTSPASGMRARVLDVLEKEGYIRGYLETQLRPGIGELTIELKYAEGEPVIREIKRVSKPGRRVQPRRSTSRAAAALARGRGRPHPPPHPPGTVPPPPPSPGPAGRLPPQPPPTARS